MADPLDVVTQRLVPAFAAVAGEPDVDAVVRPSDRADAQANGALPLAKRLGRNPRQVAEEVLAAADLDGIATAEIAGPGFINLTFEGTLLGASIAEIGTDERLGVPNTTTPQTMVIDYSAPNVAKEMHIGHLRTTVIGDSLVRLNEFIGHRVIRENHIGDWGRPFGVILEHLAELGGVEHARSMDMAELDGFYKAGSARFAGDADFAERARQRVVALQAREPETMAMWQALRDRSEPYWDDLYAKLGVLLTRDDIMGESYYEPLLPVVLERLEVAGLLQESEGALVVFPPGFTNREGEPLPLIVRSTAGAYTYATSDLACVLDRVERLHADVMKYVVGAPQAQHLSMVFEVARMAGWLVPPTEAQHVSFGNVLGPDRKMLKSRSGDAVRFADVVAEAIERGIAAVADKNPELDPDTRARVGQQVGVGALKYADLSTDRKTDYVFDWDRMLSFDGNTAPYLQYAHARICSIFRRAGLDRSVVRGVTPQIVEPAERQLAVTVLKFPTVVADTIESNSPHKLAGYVYDVATAFTGFYEHCPVLKAADEATRDSRLALSDVTARVLAAGLGLLGIAAPDQM